MSETRRKFDQESREGAVRIVRDTGKPIAQVAQDLGINAGTLGNWGAKDRVEREGTQGLSTGDMAELKRLCAALDKRVRGVLSSSVVRLPAALARASLERWAGATGLVRLAAAAGLSLSTNKAQIVAGPLSCAS
jgi:transposase-like protein